MRPGATLLTVIRRLALGYAMVFPVSMILKVFVAQLMVVYF